MEELKVYEDKMNKTLDVLLSDYGTIRAGRANPHVLDKIKGEISEDDLTEMTEKMQKLTDKMVEKVDKAVEEKTKEIMTV